MNGQRDPTTAPIDAGSFNLTAEQSTTLPASWYTDPAIFRAEHEAVFYRQWIYQCHVSDLAAAGDFYAGNVLDQDIFIMRGQDGELRAFYNVCSHRAHTLVAGQGNKSRIVCPYHQWTYSTEGQFLTARGREDIQDFDESCANLKPVRVEVFGGFVFVNLDPGAEPLAELAHGLLADMYACCPRLDELVRVHRHEVEVAANWKVVHDNNHECYHCAANHKTLYELVDFENTYEWSDGPITFSHKVTKKRDDNGAYALSESDYEQDALFGFIFPSVVPLMYPGKPSIVMFNIVPLETERTLERWDFYHLSHALSDQEKKYIDYIENVLIMEDTGLCENVQRGLHSRGYNQGRLVINRDKTNYSEHHLHFFQSLVYRALQEHANIG